MKKKYLLVAGITILLVLFVLIFSSITDSIDSSISSDIERILGESQPDSNIVIIHISSNDIEQLGPWPIKRSYYALLIKYLNQYKVKKIGLEVFLSSKFTTQSLYDNVLVKEINNAKNVSLSSLAGDIKIKSNLYVTDDFSLPSPKLLDEKITTGHINFVKNNGYLIPLTIRANGINENAFCSSLLDSAQKIPAEITVKFRSSWKKFKNYSMIEFFQIVQDHPDDLGILKNKIVMIGVSDPLLSANISSPFDENMPGIGLHAFALDNLLNNNSWNNNYYLVSKIVICVMMFSLLFVFFKERINYLVFVPLILTMILLLIIFQRFFCLQLSYSALLFSTFVIVIYDLFRIWNENRSRLKGFFNETEILKNLLKEKERSLESLQNRLSENDNNTSSGLLNKIRELKTDIAKLKGNEEDKNVFVTTSGQEGSIFYGMIYRSEIMSKVVELIKKSAPTDATILITGESGTGKELVARSIHEISNRRNENFIALNCAALTESLLESELFGHVKGAFTGALNNKPGKFELADNGTIFLDEIGETSENFQVKLLRVLQSGEYDKVGSTSTSKTNVRVIAATNKDLKQLVKENKFREDLFYRLNVIDIHLPALKDRKEDIEPIVYHLLKTGDKSYQVSTAALKVLNENDWKGNVRELESVLKRAKVFCDASGKDLIQLADLPGEIVKNIKLDFDDIVIESLRNKKFSHSSINETAKELGNLNRTIISENFRGISLKYFYECDFDLLDTVKIIVNSDDEDAKNKVKSKLDTWLMNIKKDLEQAGSNDFDLIKKKFNSKYKNLPQKFHFYLDETIKYLIKSQ